MRPHTKSIFIGLILLLSIRTALAQDGPQMTIALSTSPGAITVDWEHDNAGVDFYEVDTRLSGSSQPVLRWPGIDRESRNFTVLGLQASTAYEIRVCADYNTTLVCSHAIDAPWAPVRTMNAETPLPAPANPRGVADAAQPPAEVPTPVLTALAIREQDNGPIVLIMQATGTSALKVFTAAQRARVSTRKIYRDGQVLDETESDVVYDRNPAIVSKYRICWQFVNPTETKCSKDLAAGYLGSATSINSATFYTHVTHSGLKGQADETLQTTDDQKSRGSFILRPGQVQLAGAISIEVATNPGYFFVNTASRIRVERDNGTDDFKRRATFILSPARFYKGVSYMFNLESLSQRGAYIRVQNVDLIVDTPSPSNDWAESAAFLQTPVLFPAASALIRGDLSNTRIRDVQYPTFVDVPRTRRLGRRPGSSQATSPPANICESAQSARESGMPAATIAALDKKCAASRR